MQGEVVDNGNGTYQVRFLPRLSGEHRLFAVVSGERVHEAGLRVEAAHGPLTAADVRARVDADGKGPLSAACGSSSVINIEVHHAGASMYHLAGCGLTCHHVCLHLDVSAKTFAESCRSLTHTAPVQCSQWTSDQGAR